MIGTVIALYRANAWQTAGEIQNLRGEETQMKDTMLKLYVMAQNLLSSNEGQDLVEYALVIALIALADTAGMNTLATDISAAFKAVGNTINADV